MWVPYDPEIQCLGITLRQTLAYVSPEDIYQSIL